MKKTYLLLLFTAIFAVVGLSSCLKDEPNNVPEVVLPSATELKLAASQLVGKYDGMLNSYIPLGQYYTKVDSTQTQWEMTDTTLIVKSFPAKFLARNIVNDSLKKAVEALPNQTLTCAIRVFDINPTLFYVQPQSINLGHVKYEGKEHEVSINFAFFPNFTYGGYVQSTKTMTVRFMEQSLLVDGELQRAGLNDYGYFYITTNK